MHSTLWPYHCLLRENFWLDTTTHTIQDNRLIVDLWIMAIQGSINQKQGQVAKY